MIYLTGFLLLALIFSRVKKPFGKMSINLTRTLLIGSLLILFFSLRSIETFGDTITYVSYFKDYNTKWNGLIDLLKNNREPLYQLLVICCKKLTNSYIIFLFTTSIIPIIGFSLLLNDYSDDMFISIIIFAGLGLMFFFMAGLRQAIAIGCTTFAFRYAKKRKIIPFLIWCLIAFGFHNSSIVFIFVYFIIKIKPTLKAWIAVVVAFVLGVSKNPVVMKVANYFLTKEYTKTSSLTYSMFFIQLVFVAFCFVYRNRVLTSISDNEYDSFLSLSFVGLCFQALTPIMGEFFRVSSYFSIYLCVAVPKVLSTMKKRDKGITSFVIIIGLLLYIYIFSGLTGYKLFFEI